MNDHGYDSSYASAVIPLKRLFAGKLEPQRRSVEDVYAAAGRGSGYTQQENRIWLRGATAELVKLGLVKRIRSGGDNSSVTHILLTASGKQVLGDALLQDAPAPESVQEAVEPTPEAPVPHDEPTFDGIMRDIKRFCELHNCQFEWTMTKREGVPTSR